MVDDDEFGEGESSGKETNLSNSSALKKSTRVGYLTFRGNQKGGNNSKKGGDNTKKGIKAARGSD